MNIWKTKCKHTQTQTLTGAESTLWAIPNKTLTDAAEAGHTDVQRDRGLQISFKGKAHLVIGHGDMVICLLLIRNLTNTHSEIQTKARTSFGVFTSVGFLQIKLHSLGCQLSHIQHFNQVIHFQIRVWTIKMMYALFPKKGISIYNNETLILIIG